MTPNISNPQTYVVGGRFTGRLQGRSKRRTGLVVRPNRSKPLEIAKQRLADYAEVYSLRFTLPTRTVRHLLGG